MKKVLALGFVALVIVLGWFGWQRLMTPQETTVSVDDLFPPKSKMTAAAPTSVSASVAANPTKEATTPAKETAPQLTTEASLEYPQMQLEQVLQPNNLFHDPIFGVSVTYPEGWSVRNARRWGEANKENTVFFAPPEGSQAVPSMYYQMYPDGAPSAANPEAMLRDMAQKKEEARSMGGQNDYKNDPDSFVFRQIDGNPSLSYFATYTQNGETRAEYFTRILGPKGYVMFFVRGPVKDVQAAIPDVSQMSGTVKPP